MRVLNELVIAFCCYPVEQSSPLVKKDIRRFCIHSSPERKESGKFTMLFIVKYVIGCFPNKTTLIVTTDLLKWLIMFSCQQHLTTKISVTVRFHPTPILLSQGSGNLVTNIWPFNYAHVRVDIVLETSLSINFSLNTRTVLNL